MTSFTESWPIRVYYEDTDHGGVVYYANYLKYMERARIEFLRSAGLELDAIEDEFGVMFAVRQANVSYHAPARFNELLNVESALVEMRGARIAFQQHICRKNDGQMLTHREIQLACISRDGSVCRIPKAVIEKLKSHLNRTY